MRTSTCAFPTLALLFLAWPTSAKTIRGFVTAVDSPTTWEIDDYKISLVPDAKLKVSDAKEPTAAFKPSDVQIGTELQAEGDYNESTHELKAKSVQVFFFDTRQISRVTLLQTVPELEKSDSGGWHGFLPADGQRVVVTDSTTIGLMPQLKENKETKTNSRGSSPNVPAPALTSLAPVGPDSVVYYVGETQSDGSVLATKLEFDVAGPDPAEESFQKKYAPKIKDPDFARGKPGQIKLPGRRYKILSDADVQKYISHLGESLIPQSQKDLPDGSLRKVRFSFYVAANDHPDAGGFPSGVVVIYSGLIQSLDNEAQLAYMLSREISRVVEEDSWRDREYHKGQLMALRGGALAGDAAGFLIPGFGLVTLLATNQAAKNMLNSDPYARSLENQRDREALQWTLASGYDIREAPFAWQKLLREYGNGLKEFWAVCDTRRSYLAAQLALVYKSEDYSNLKKDSEDFHRISQKIQDYERKQATSR